MELKKHLRASSKMFVGIKNNNNKSGFKYPKVIKIGPVMTLL